jgi:hypothetical protein
LVALAAPVPALAQSEFAFSWDAPPNCPQESAVRERLRSLGAELKRPGRLEVEGHIVRSGERYELTLAVHEGNVVRKRTMTSDSCADLAGAAAVALGLILRSSSSGAASDATAPGTAANGDEGTDSRAKKATDAETERASAASAAGSATGRNSGSTAKASAGAAAKSPSNDEHEKSEANAHEQAEGASHSGTPSGNRRLHALLRAPFVTLDVGRLPKPSGALGAGLGFRYDEWHFLAIGRIFKGQTVSAPDAPNIGAHVNRGTLEFWACRGWRSGAWELAPCLDVGLERLATHGTGGDVAAQSDTVVSLVLGAGGLARLEVSSFLALVGSLALGFETSRPSLVLGEFGPVHELGWAQISFGLGPEWIF